MKLRDTKICLDCDELFGLHHEACPVCGSRHFHWMADWIPPIAPACAMPDCERPHSGRHADRPACAATGHATPRTLFGFGEEVRS